MNSNPQLIKDEISPPKKKTPINEIHKKSWTISEAHKEVMVSMIGSGLTASEIVEEAKERFGIEVTPNQIREYSHCEKWKPLIKKIKDAYMQDLTDIPGYYKKVRLRRHEKTYEKAMQKGKLKEATNAVVEQRKEIEGDIGNSVVNNTLNIYSDEELEFKKKQVIERIKLMTANAEKEGDKK